jgi:UDP-N-acetylmuramyl pentapeptide synthase
MKKFAKQAVLRLLTRLAKIRLKRLGLFVIGVTGSVGKTSTKEAIFNLLHKHYQVIRSDKSYNTEFGLPLAILEQNSGFSSPLKWIQTILGAVYKAFFGGRHLQMLVLEMGVDKPGDMDALLKIVRPHISIMTNIRAVHLDKGQFKDLDDIFLEKKKIVEALPEKGVAVLNADDPYISTLRGKLNCKVLWYGRADFADLRSFGLKTSLEEVAFKIAFEDQETVFRFPYPGEFQDYILLPAFAVGLILGMTLKEITEFLHDFRLPPGRMNPIKGIHDSLILDSSYNASPEAVKYALNVLGMAQGRRIAVLGDMNELGVYSDAKHREIGAIVVNKTDMLVTVGNFSRLISEEAVSKGFPADAVMHFNDAYSAASALKGKISAGDTILVKGSQNKIRLERLVKELMLDKSKAAALLVRQSREWEKIK